MSHPHRLQHRRIFRMFSIAAALGCYLFLASCAGYYHSKAVSEATFVPNQAASPHGTLPIHLTYLGQASVDPKVVEVIDRAVAKTRGRSVTERFLFSADCGIQAMYAGDLDRARKLLDESIVALSSVTVGGKPQEEATSAHGAESAKVFKGEPHERVTIYLYRALLYIADGDYENAHACLLNAALQDASAEVAGSRGDWLVCDLLLLQCKWQIGDPSAADFAEWCTSRYGNEIPNDSVYLRPIDHPVVILVATGRAPSKRTGTDGNIAIALQYTREPSAIMCVEISGASGLARGCASDDLYIQAATRGTRQMDTILSKKKGSADKLEALGTVAATAGQIAGGPVAVLLGTLIMERSMSESDKINTAADVRQLHSVPATFHLALFDAATSPPGRVVVRALGSDDHVVAQQAIEIDQVPRKSAVVLGWIGI